MLLIGNKSEHPVSKFISSGLYGNKVVPVLNYQGDYSVVYSEGSEKKFSSSRFTGMIEDTFIIDEQVCYFVNREASAPFTAVSLLYMKDGDVKIWFPYIKDLMEILECLYSVDKRCIAAIREISERLSRSTDFNVTDVAKAYEQDNYLVRRERFNDDLPVPVLYSLVKNIMISEDKKYEKDTQLGRYFMQMAFYDYVCCKENLNKVLKKYRLYPNQKWE